MRNWRFGGLRILVTVALCLAMVPATVAGGASDTRGAERVHGVEGVDYAPGRVIVRFSSTTSSAQRAMAHARAGAGSARAVSGLEGIEIVRLKDGVSVTSAVEEYSKQPGVLSAEPSYRLTLDFVPNDPLFSQLWGLENTGQDGGVADADIDAPEAWDTTVGTDTVTVAVIDTGVDYAHPDLAANIWTNPGEIPGNMIDDDGNGYVDDVHGIDTANNDSNPMDDHGHGTHVAGTVAAVGNNHEGVVGVAHGVKVMPLKFFDASGTGWQDAAIECIAYAKAMGAQIINASYGGPSPVEAEAAAIAQFGGIFCASAGNDGSDNDVYPHYPSSYNLDNIIAVAASNNADGRASFSNFGRQSVDLAAPGTEITSTVMGGGYGAMSGTSMAAPHVSGAAALVLSKSSFLTGAQVRKVLEYTVDVLDSFEGDTSTEGRLNLASAVRLDPDFDAPDVTDDHIPSYLETATVSIVASDSVSGVASLHYIRDGAFPVKLASSEVTLTGFSLGYHEITYWAIDNMSNESTPVTIDFVVLPDSNPPVVIDDAGSTYAGAAYITITATDDLGVASISTELDGEDVVRTPGGTATVYTDVLGDHVLTYYASDVNGNRSDPVTLEFRVVRSRGAVPTEIAGTDRYETAVAASRAAFPDGADAVVIASGAGWPDALSASALAGVVDGPLLLTQKTVVPPSVLLEIERLGAKHVFLVGGTGVIGEEVRDRLRQMVGMESVERLAGTDRYGTAQMVATRVIEHEGARFSRTALVVTGRTFADSLAAAPLANAFGWPLLLAADSGTLYAPYEVDRVVIVGGTGAVSRTVEEALVADLGADNVVRIAGSDRYETGARISQYGVDHGLWWNGLCMATGEDYPDGLSGGALAGRLSTVVLLTTPTTLAPPSASVLDENKDVIDTVRFIGGTAAISTSVRAAVAQLIE